MRETTIRAGQLVASREASSSSSHFLRYRLVKLYCSRPYYDHRDQNVIKRRKTDMANRDLVEEVSPQQDAQSKPEPTQQRTVEQQKKQDNIIAQNKRQAGEESNRSRSQSRRARRKRIEKQMDDGKFMKTNSLPALEEADANQEMMAMQPFQRIGPDSTSMDGPVTMARAERGEIPVRGTHPGQSYYMKPKEEKGVGAPFCCWCLRVSLLMANVCW